MKFLIAILGLLIVFGLAILVSSDRKKVKIKPIILMVVIQLILTYLLLNTKFGLVIINSIADGFGKLLEWANEGITFVFGGIVNEGASPFFLNVLLPIVFISALIGILQHFKILPFIMKWIGFLLSKVNGMGKLESYNAVASAIVGQSEVFITLKKQLGSIPPISHVYALCISHVNCIDVDRWRLYDDD